MPQYKYSCIDSHDLNDSKANHMLEKESKKFKIQNSKNDN